MYEYIKGNLCEINPAFAVIETGGIGYNIHISVNTYTKIQDRKDEACKLFLHQLVREDAHLLYGFFDKHERELFRLLISVSGVGANTARMMLSSLSANDIQIAIQKADVDQLKSIKGIGIKTAQRIILDLKDKVGKTTDEHQISVPKDNTIRDESLSALIALGFAKKTAETAIDKILKATGKEPVNVEFLIKKALKEL